MTPKPAVGDRILNTLQSTFGYSAFRPLQEDVIRTLLQGRDAFVLMPTGGGKSLCYQLPALLSEGTTLVISPLIALMKDQVDALHALGIAATFINSSLDVAEINRRQAALTQGQLKLVYVAPERLMMSGFLTLLETTRLALIAIDEAHCISEWGHDFRPEYRELRRLRSAFPRVPVGAFTATATARVQADIKSQLGLESARTFHGSFNRPNLSYDVRPKERSYEQLLAYLREHRGASGIIYCMSRAGTEDLARRLTNDGFGAVPYHAGITAEERRARQDAFIKDDVDIIVATVAFGMGIDKPDVRFVVHYDLPRTLEGFYQESGRAGRDGEPSDCLLFYSNADVIKYRRFIDEKDSAEERRVAVWQLQQMADWADRSTCRRRALLAYFDEDFDGQDAPCCDVCSTPRAQDDFTLPAQMFLSCVKRTGERFGAAHVIAVLRGSHNERIQRLGHDKISTHGIGRDHSEGDWRHLARELVGNGYLRQVPEEFNALKVTERGRDVLFNDTQVLLVAPPTPVSAAHEGSTTPHSGLFDRLRAVRKRLADEHAIPPYVIFHDTTLKHMSASLPVTVDQLLKISGVGKHKASAYGKAFLAVIAAYIEETGAEPADVPAPAVLRTPSKGGLGATVCQTLKLFLQGHDIGTIAEMRSIAPDTVGTHLSLALEAGEPVDIDRVVSAAKRQAIQKALAHCGPAHLRPIMEYLGDGYTYTELRLVRAATLTGHVITS